MEKQGIADKCLALVLCDAASFNQAHHPHTIEKMEKQGIVDKCLALVLCGAASFNQAHQHHTIEK